MVIALEKKKRIQEKMQLEFVVFKILKNHHRSFYKYTLKSANCVQHFELNFIKNNTIGQYYRLINNSTNKNVKVQYMCTSYFITALFMKRNRHNSVV